MAPRTAKLPSGPRKTPTKKTFLPPLVVQMIQDKAYGLQRAAADAHSILGVVDHRRTLSSVAQDQVRDRKYIKEHNMFAKWNRFFRLLESEKYLPEDSSFLKAIAAYAFGFSTKLNKNASETNKNIMDLRMTAAVAMEKYMSQSFVGADFVAGVLMRMVLSYRETPINATDFENRVMHILEKLVIPKMALDFGQKPARVHYLSMQDIFATHRQEQIYGTSSIHGLLLAMETLKIVGGSQASRARHVRIFQRVCGLIPTLFYDYIENRYGQQTDMSKCRAIRIYRETCSAETVRLIDRALWKRILLGYEGSLEVAACFIAGTTVSVRQKVHGKLPLNYAESAENPELAQMIRNRIKVQARRQ
jgi:hypothetical protein